jgi:hypothetical protein
MKLERQVEGSSQKRKPDSMFSTKPAQLKDTFEGEEAAAPPDLAAHQGLTVNPQLSPASYWAPHELLLGSQSLDLVEMQT